MFLEFCFIVYLISTLHIYGMQNHRIQLAINVQIPVDFGGLGRKAVYVGESFLFSGLHIFVSKLCTCMFRYRRQLHGRACFTNG